MAHHEEKGVHWFLRGVKTKWAEPGAEKLANYLMGHPLIRKVLNGIDPELLKNIGSGVEFAAGPIEIPGKGALAYILNEAADSFMKGIGRNLKQYADMSPDEIANDLFAIRAVDKAVEHLNAFIAKKVVLDLTERTFHFEGCALARGKATESLGSAIRQGFAPKNCRCTGEVWNGFATAKEESDKAPAVADPLTVIELMDEIEKEAVETENPVLLGYITRFNTAFFGLSPELRLKFEYLAKEKRPKEKLKLLIAKSERDWEATIDAMLDDPMQAKAEGVFKSVVGGIGSLGSRTFDFLSEGRKNLGVTMTEADTAIRRSTAALDVRYAKAVKKRAFNKKFRKHQNAKRGWFAYLAVGTFAFTVIYIVLHAVTH